MKQQIERQTHTIDATGKSLGRLAVEVSVLLRGKHKPSFAPHKDEGDFVVIQHPEKVVLTGRKMDQKVYYRHSQYAGGLKKKPVRTLFATQPQEVLRKAVWGMLPGNKLRKEQIKRLTFE